MTLHRYQQKSLFSVKSASFRYRIYIEEKKEKQANTEAANETAIISNDMAKLKDQRDAIKRTITKGSVMKVRKNPELLEEQYSV